MAGAYKILVGDTVKVIAGTSKGRVGKILSVCYKGDAFAGRRRMIVVSGVNLQRIRDKRAQTTVVREVPIDASNAMYLDPVTLTVTRVGFATFSSGKKGRVTKGSSKEIVRV